MNRNQALACLRKISFDDFSWYFDCEKIPTKRLHQFYDVINEKMTIDESGRFYIQEYALRFIFNEKYKKFEDEHFNSSGQLYEFDPSKNGKNLVKHGVAFNEVWSYSKKFGTLSIPFLDLSGEERVISFSDFNLEGKYKAIFPLSEIINLRYCVSIIKNTEKGKIRFISSRFLSSRRDKCYKTIYDSLNHAAFCNEKLKKDFVNRVIEILQRNLFID